MSDPTPQQRQLTHEHVIVFNVTAGTLTFEKAVKHKDHIEDPNKMLKIAPRLGNTVTIKQDGRLVANLKLHRLGKFATTMRMMGKCDQIIVIP